MYKVKVFTMKMDTRFIFQKNPSLRRSAFLEKCRCIGGEKNKNLQSKTSTVFRPKLRNSNIQV